jgi:alkylated DNA repair dioxygenase AlkB
LVATIERQYFSLEFGQSNIIATKNFRSSPPAKIRSEIEEIIILKNKSTVNFVRGDLFSKFNIINSNFNTCENNERLLYEPLSMNDAEVIFYPNLFEPQESDCLFQVLRDEIIWRQDKIKLYGKEMDLPRKIAWYGDRNKSYTFSRIRLEPLPWTQTLLAIKERIETIAKVEFNSVLLNFYRDGKDSNAWHTDDEPELGKNPTIASVSFGGTRRFMFRYKQDKNLKTELQLTHGSFLLMSGTTQHFWQHQIPKTAKNVAPRINLTFRKIIL